MISHQVFEANPSDGKGRKLGVLIGSALAGVGFALWYKFWHYPDPVCVDNGLVSGGHTFAMAGLVSGVFLATMGIVLMGRATLGHWDWSRKSIQPRP